jgi:hypothetical protein
MAGDAQLVDIREHMADFKKYLKVEVMPTHRERMHFACFAEVPRGEPCLVEAIILGRKRLRRQNSRTSTGFLAQWRATAVSLPLQERVLAGLKACTTSESKTGYQT